LKRAKRLNPLDLHQALGNALFGARGNVDGKPPHWRKACLKKNQKARVNLPRLSCFVFDFPFYGPIHIPLASSLPLFFLSLFLYLLKVQFREREKERKKKEKRKRRGYRKQG
jgi:hypothetical protein